MRSNHRTWLAAAGAGTTTFLVVAVLVVEVLAFEFAAIVAIPVGLIAGLLAHGAVRRYYRDVGAAGRLVTDAVAGAGYAFLLVAAVTYVDLAGLGSVLSFGTSIGVVVAGGVLAGVASWLADSGRFTRTNS